MKPLDTSLQCRCAACMAVDSDSIPVTPDTQCTIDKKCQQQRYSNAGSRVNVHDNKDILIPLPFFLESSHTYPLMPNTDQR